MPKFSKSKVAGYYIYYDTSCLDEPVHAHAIKPFGPPNTMYE